MIVGNGLIASLFQNHDNKNVIFFASGVSNSMETDARAFYREQELIQNTIHRNKNKLFIYFSTCSIYDSSKVGSAYILHKLRMEQIISETAPNHLILRVSNAVGKGGNPNLLMNYITRSAINEECIDVFLKARRNLIDTRDIFDITRLLVENKDLHNQIINVAYHHNFSILEIVEAVEKHFKISIKTKLINEGSSYDIDISELKEYYVQRGKQNKDNYLREILNTYYPR